MSRLVDMVMSESWEQLRLLGSKRWSSSEVHETNLDVK